MIKQYLGCIITLGMLAGCGSASDALPQAGFADASVVRQALAPDTFGAAFSATIGWPAFVKNSDGGCADAIAEVNQARAGLAAEVQWSSVTTLNIYDETVMAWGTFRGAGCSTVGKPPQEVVPMPTRCDGLRQNVASGWQIVVTTPAYRSLVRDGIIGTVEQAFDAALASGCIY